MANKPGYTTLGFRSSPKEREVVRKLTEEFHSTTTSDLLRRLVNHPDFPTIVRILLSPRRIKSIQDIYKEEKIDES